MPGKVVIARVAIAGLAVRSGCRTAGPSPMPIRQAGGVGSAFRSAG